MMDKKFKACNRERMYLPPPSLQERLPEKHPVYFLIEVVDRLELSEIYA